MDLGAAIETLAHGGERFSHIVAAGLRGHQRDLRHGRRELVLDSVRKLAKQKVVFGGRYSRHARILHDTSLFDRVDSIAQPMPAFLKRIAKF